MYDKGVDCKKKDFGMSENKKRIEFLNEMERKGMYPIDQRSYGHREEYCYNKN